MDTRQFRPESIGSFLMGTNRVDSLRKSYRDGLKKAIKMQSKSFLSTLVVNQSTMDWSAFVSVPLYNETPGSIFLPLTLPVEHKYLANWLQLFCGQSFSVSKKKFKIQKCKFFLENTANGTANKVRPIPIFLW